MKDYRKIPFKQIKDFPAYAVKMLKKGHVIIWITVNDILNRVIEFKGYANDRKRQRRGYEYYEYRYLRLENSVIAEYMMPSYNDEHLRDASDIGIYISDNSLDSFRIFVADMSGMKDYYSGKSFPCLEGSYHYEFYISIEKDNLRELDFGATMGLEFVREWCEEKGILPV